MLRAAVAAKTPLGMEVGRKIVPHLFEDTRLSAILIMTERQKDCTGNEWTGKEGYGCWSTCVR